MERLLRTVLIWLVALSIPAQGMAAVAMLHCGPGHHSAQAVGVTAKMLPEAAHAKHSAHGYVDHLVPGAEAAADVVAPANVDAVAAAGTAVVSASDSDPSTQPPNQKCSACAACCAGLALPSAVALLPTLDPVREVTVLSPTWTVGMAVDGLERPPRIPRV